LGEPGCVKRSRDRGTGDRLSPFFSPISRFASTEPGVRGLGVEEVVVLEVRIGVTIRTRCAGGGWLQASKLAAAIFFCTLLTPQRHPATPAARRQPAVVAASSRVSRPPRPRPSRRHPATPAARRQPAAQVIQAGLGDTALFSVTSSCHNCQLSTQRVMGARENRKS